MVKDKYKGKERNELLTDIADVYHGSNKTIVKGFNKEIFYINYHNRKTGKVEVETRIPFKIFDPEGYLYKILKMIFE